MTDPPEASWPLSSWPLFIYGSLKRTRDAAERMRGARFLRAAATEPGWTLLDLGRYPGLVRGNGHVVGELYAVPPDLLVRLDAYEGTAEGYYERIAIALADGTAAQTYHYTGDRSMARPHGAEW